MQVFYDFVLKKQFFFFLKKNTKIQFWIVFISSCNTTIFRITQ